MKFLCLAYLDRGLAPAPGVAAEYGALGEAMREAGVLVDNGQLGPPAAGQEPTAYFVLDCLDPGDPLEWAARIPAASYGSIQVRPPR
jgi:hypothetical protein